LLAIIGGVLFFSIFLLPETLPINKRKKASIKSAFVTYFNLLSQKTFMRYTLCVTFYYVSAYAFITGSPAVYITYFGIDAQHYGWLFAVNIIGVMGMSFINRFLVHRFELSSLLKIATSIATCATVIMAVTFKADLMPIYFIIGMAFIFFSMNGIVAAVATAAALDEVPSIAGSASALIGSLQYGSGIISTLLLSYFSDGTPWAMVWIMCLFALFSFLIVYKAK